MSLSNDLISQFVKITNDNKKTKKETTTYGTVSKDGDSTYVQLDGSETLTPVVSTVNTNDGDRVVVMIKNHTAYVTGNMTFPAANNNDVISFDTQITELGVALADKVDTKVLEAERARIDTLVVENVTVKERLAASEATIGELEADKIVVHEQLTANTASIDKLKAATADIEVIRADVATIDELIFGSAGGNVIQTNFANAVIAQLGNAQIKSAMIDSVSASKITAGDIITNNVRVKSEDGSLLISDETMQISDGTRVRVQIGKDASNDYSINIWDASGNLMFSKGGITDSAIKTAIIRNDMVSDTANIAAHKLDIDSLFEEINGSTKTIKSTRVYLDENKQTLDVIFKSLSDNVSSQGTALSLVQGQISSKVWQQDINNATGAMSTQYSTLEQSLNGFKTEVGKTYATNSKVASLELTANGLTTKLSDLAIGGRNYFSGKTRTAFNENNEFTLGAYQGVGSFSQFYNLTVPMKTFVGKKCVLSFDCISPNGSTPISVYNNNGDARYNISTSGLITPIDNAWVHQELIVTVTDRGEGHVDSVSDKIEVYASDKLGVKIKNVKFEVGTKATDWTPAPEDVNSDILVASKTATNYMNLSTAGLVIGDMTASALGKNVLIDSEAVKVRTGNAVNAVFGADIIELAKNNESATISMLNGAFKIYYDNTIEDGGFGIYGRTTNGQMRLAFQPVNENNNLTLGWGGYADRANSTNLYGHKMYLTTNEDIILNPGSGNIQMDGNVLLTNGKNIFGKNTNGDLRSMAILNTSNQMIFGYGSYSNNEGVVFYDGNDVSVRSKTDIRLISTKDVILDPTSGEVKIDGNVTIPNAKNLYGTNASGTTRSIVTLNASNQLLFGYGSYSNNEGSAYYDGNNVYIRSKNDITLQTVHDSIVLQDGDGNATYNAFFRPASNAKCALGTNANRWYAVYASNATIQTSDLREKENIVSLSDIHSSLFDSLKPVEYNFINGNGKICYGLISQDVIAAMEKLGIGKNDLDLVHYDTYVDNAGETKETFGIAYSNLIAMLIHEVQKLKTEIKSLKTA